MQCQHCHRNLAPKEPAYRLALWRGHPWVPLSASATMRYVCSDCAPQGYHHPPLDCWPPPEPCLHCGRPVIASPNRRLTKLIVCGPQCRRVVYAAQARVRRDHAMRRCRTCGTSLMTKRASTRYCSAACKQRAYRRPQGALPVPA